MIHSENHYNYQKSFCDVCLQNNKQIHRKGIESTSSYQISASLWDQNSQQHAKKVLTGNGLRWINIGHAISHELHQNMSSWLMLILQNNNIEDAKIFDTQTIRFVSRKLKSEHKVNDKEIEYLNKLIQRSKSYRMGIYIHYMPNLYHI